MRLRHFCIGSSVTQDLLISKTFLPLGTSDEDADIQKVWTTFLDLFQTEHRWTQPGGPQRQLEMELGTDHQHQSRRSGAAPAGMAGNRADDSRRGEGITSASSPLSSPSIPSSSSSSSAGKQQQHNRSLARPLYSRDSCFIYHTTNDLVLVACCPLPPTPSTATSTRTRIPLSLPSSSSKSSTPSIPGTPMSDSAYHLQKPQLQQTRHQQQQRAELAFSAAPGLQHISAHGMIEFLGQFVKALERYLLTKNSGNSHGAGGTSRRTSATSTSGTTGSATLMGSQAAAAAAAVMTATVSSSSTLSAELVQSNVGIVYEILDECMELGYPMMPSLAQLDLLVFGVAKSS